MAALSGPPNTYAAPGLEFLVNLWKSWSNFLLAGIGAIALFITLLVWLVRSEE